MKGYSPELGDITIIKYKNGGTCQAFLQNGNKLNVEQDEKGSWHPAKYGDGTKKGGVKRQSTTRWSKPYTPYSTLITYGHPTYTPMCVATTRPVGDYEQLGKVIYRNGQGYLDNYWPNMQGARVVHSDDGFRILLPSMKSSDGDEVSRDLIYWPAHQNPLIYYVGDNSGVVLTSPRALRNVKILLKQAGY